ATGARTILADAQRGDGPDSLYIQDIEVFGDAALLAGLVLPDTPAILRLDLTTGDREVLSGDGDGMGPDFGDTPDDVTGDPAGTQIWAVVGHSDDTATVLSVDPTTGTR